MRTSIACILLTGLAACSSSVPFESPIGPAPDAGRPDAAPDDARTPPPPPPIDGAIEVPTDAGDGPLVPPTRGFQIASPPIDIEAHADITWCFYFKTPNAADLAISGWESRMTAGTHDMIVYVTPTGKLQPPGTMSQDNCGFASGVANQAWTYAAQTASATAMLPANDGTGKPLAQIIKAGQFGFIQMHFVNPTDATVRAHVELNGYAYPETTQVTPVAPFVTYNTKINIARSTGTGPTPGVAKGSCAVSPDAKFFQMTSHTYKQGVHTFVQDSLAVNAQAPMVFESHDWERPGEQTWGADPFFSFTSGKLTYQCEYLNPTASVIVDGDRPAADETCMVVGFFFPTAADGQGHLCLDDNLFY